MIALPPDARGPLYRQIYQAFREQIQRGALRTGQKLPSKRALAAQLSVSLSTVETAYAQLTSEGYVRAVPKSGLYVNALDELVRVSPLAPRTQAPAAPRQQVQIDFSTGGVDAQAFPYNTWRRLLRQCFDECDPTLLTAAPHKGDEALRHAVCQYLQQARGVRCSVEQVVIGAGTDHLLSVLGGLLPANGRVAVENPVYNRVLRVFRQAGREVRAVDIDGEGMALAPLYEGDIGAAYITPSHQFPIGISMPIGRRIQLLNWAQERGAYLIEDDYDSEFRYHVRPIPSLQSIDNGARVVYLGTFSKSVAPALRISYMVLPQPLLTVYEARYAGFHSAVSRFEQKVLCAFLEQGHFERHLNRMRKRYGDKRALLSQALQAHGVRVLGESAGHHVRAFVSTAWSEADLCRAALAHGVKVYPISPYFVHGVPAAYAHQVMLGYGALSCEQIERGVALLAQAWAL